MRVWWLVVVLGCGRVNFDDVTTGDAGNGVSGLGPFGTSGTSTGRKIAISPDGNLAVVGSFDAEMTFAGVTLPNAGNGDLFVTSLDPRGDLRWVRSYGTPGRDGAHGVAVDSSSRVLLIGELGGPLTIGADNLVNQGEDILFATFDRDGAPLSARRFGPDNTTTPYGSDRGIGVAIDRDGVVLTGNCKGALDFGPGVICGQATTPDGYDAFAVSLDVAGAHRWSLGIGGTRYNEIWDAAIDSAGAYLVGFFEGTPDLGAGINATNMGLQDGFVVALNPQGGFRWSAELHGSEFDWPLAATVDPAGNVYIAGFFSSPTLDVAGQTLTQVGAGDAYLASYTQAGTPRWARAFATAGCDSFSDLTTLASGELVVSGRFGGTVDFGTGPLTPEGPGDGIAIGFDSSGATLWTRVVSSPGVDTIRGVAGLSSTTLFATGSYDGNTIGCGNSEGSSEVNGFILAL